MTLPSPGDPARVFAFGIIGSLLVGVVQAIRSEDRGRPLRARYRHWSLSVPRSLLAAGSGLLAVAYAVQSDILAVQIGITPPSRIDAMIQSGSRLDRDDLSPAP